MEKEKYESELSKILPPFSKKEILNVALYKINQGCCCQYVSDELKEWYGIDISPEEIESELIDNPELLPAKIREKNSWDHIFHDDTDELVNIDRMYLGRKYGYGWRYLDAIISSYIDGRKIGQQTALIREGLAHGWMTREQAVRQLIDNTCLSEDEAKAKVSKIMEEIRNEKER